MKRDPSASSFVIPTSSDAGNVYELVVVAALRARQLNRFPQLRDRDATGTIVDQAVREAATKKLAYAIAEREEVPAQVSRPIEG
ncbi:MAG: DNA-directed RNA polymerase subunit omega [Candidatus Eisenbacteria bacterium]|nr:DNA-directed RNA polymerase subunit omega [Candidatus Eisenbacteria bacterium]